MDKIKNVMNSMKLEVFRYIFTKKFVRNNRQMLFYFGIPAVLFQMFYVNKRWFTFREYLLKGYLHNSTLTVENIPVSEEEHAMISKYNQQNLPR